MAFRKITALLGLIISLTFIPAGARADDCVTIDMLAQSLAPKGIKLFGSMPSATKRLVETVNKNRATNGKPPIEATILVVGPMMDDNNNIRIGVAFFDANHCVISDTIANLSSTQWADFLADAKVDPKEFAPFEDS